MKKTVTAWMMFAVLVVAKSFGGQESGERRALDVFELKAVPPGHYLVNLQAEGTNCQVNVEVKGSTGKCVNASDPRLKGFEGQFELIGNGVFHVMFRNKDYTASQWWLFRKDGSAVVKEVPDRGEKQTAVPVADDSLQPPPSRR